jgi:MFS family permease
MQNKRHEGQKAVLARAGRFLQSGWFVQGDEVSNQSRQAILMHNVGVNVIANLTGGNFFTGLLIVLQADDAFVGLMTMLTFGANLLQLFTPYILERFHRRKPLLIVLRMTVHLVSIVFTGIIPFLPAVMHTRLLLLGISVFLVNALSAVLAPGFSVWHIAHIPPSVRVQFFSLVTLLNGVFIAVFNLLGSGVVDLFKRNGSELWGLTALRIACVLIAVFDFTTLIRIKELPQRKMPQKIRLSGLLREPWRHPAYLRSTLVIFLWSLVANLPGSFYTVYLLRELGVSYSYIMLVNSFNVVVLTLMTFLWRRIFLRFGWLKPLALAVLLFAPHYFLLAFVSDNLLFLYPIGIIWSFLCTSGINLAFTSVAYINLPEENQTLHIGFFSTANFLAALSAATLARAFVTRFHGLRFSLFSVPFGEKQLLMLIVGFLMIGVGLGILAIWHKNKQQGLET